MPSYKNIGMYCLSQYLTSDIIKFFTFSFWQQKTKFHPFCHSDILAQVTDTLESQFWGICFFSWHSTQKTTKKSVEHQHYSKVWQCHNIMWLDRSLIIEDSTFIFNYKCKNIYLNTVLHSTYDCWLLVLLQNHKMLNISLGQSHKTWQCNIKLSLQP